MTLASDLESDLSVTCAERDGGVTVHVAGDLDTYTSIKLRRVIDDYIRQRVSAITLNMIDVTFIDSGGLGLLVSSQRAAHGAGIAFSLTQPSGAVARLLDVTGMLDRLVSPA